MKKFLRIYLIAIFMFSGLSACAPQSGPLPPEYALHNRTTAQTSIMHGEAFLRTELFFGMSIAAAPDHPAGMVTEVQWQNFVDTRITPLFPNGLTVIDGYGQWLGKNATPAKEHSKVLILLHPASAPDEWARIDRAIDEIRATYCHLFHQNSVLRVTSSVTVAF